MCKKEYYLCLHTTLYTHIKCTCLTWPLPRLCQWQPGDWLTALSLSVSEDVLFSGGKARGGGSIMENQDR